MPPDATNGTGRRLAAGLALLLAAVLGAGCERFDTLVTLFRNSDLEFLYTGDAVRGPERASVSLNTRVVAQARRLNVRPTADPSVTEIEIEETHFRVGRPDVLYTGRVVFRCRRGEDFCAAVRATPASGSRPRDVFWRWPVSMASGLPPEHRQ